MLNFGSTSFVILSVFDLPLSYEFMRSGVHGVLAVEESFLTTTIPGDLLDDVPAAFVIE